MISSPKFFLVIICHIFLTINLLSQTVYPSPYVSIKLSSTRIAIYEPLSISWNCVDPESTIASMEYRYKLDAPGDWLGGVKYNINKWSSWINGATNRIIYGDFILEGSYAISVQCRNKKTGRESKVVTSKFTVYWEYPELQEEAFIIDWDKVSLAKSEHEKYQILAQEYKSAYLLWNRKFEVELRKLNLTGSSIDYLNIISSELTEEGQILLVKTASKKSAKIISQILFPITIYEIIKGGAVDLILIYRNYEANKASTMTVASYHAWKRFEELAKNTPEMASVTECPEFFGDRLPDPVIKSLSKYEVKVGDIIELKGCWLTTGYNNDHAWIENSKGFKGCIWVEDGATDELIRIKIVYRLCQYYDGSMDEPCDSWFFLEPGDYFIYVHPGVNKSNRVKFRVLPPQIGINDRNVRSENYVVAGTSNDKSDPYLNVRSGPGTDFPIIRKLSDGTKVIVIDKYLGKDKNWMKIMLATNNDFVGYVNSKYLKPY